MLKPPIWMLGRVRARQPPSGGCVLKRKHPAPPQARGKAAAFGRLCVETSQPRKLDILSPAAAFGRLCVETAVVKPAKATVLQPPSGGCVLKQSNSIKIAKKSTQPPSGGCVLKLLRNLRNNFSAFAAAFGRLCVETPDCLIFLIKSKGSRLRAAVC